MIVIVTIAIAKYPKSLDNNEIFNILEYGKKCNNFSTENKSIRVISAEFGGQEYDFPLPIRRLENVSFKDLAHLE